MDVIVFGIGKNGAVATIFEVNGRVHYESGKKAAKDELLERFLAWLGFTVIPLEDKKVF